MTRLSFLLGAALLAVAACTVAPPGGSPSPAPATAGAVATATDGTPSSGPTSTPRPSPTPVSPGVGLCPTDSLLTVWQLVESDPACFGGDDVTVRGWLDLPPALGWEGPAVEPGWVYYPARNMSFIWGGRPIGPEQACELDGHSCGGFFPHVDPASGVELEGPPRWLLITGHFQDPAAETCHYVYPDDHDDQRADDRYAVEACRGSFVLVEVREAP